MRLFVTGSGTEVGKTLAAGVILHQLERKGRPARAAKPILSGFDPANVSDSDPALLLEAAGSTPTPAAIEETSPWRFREPLSPDMAAAREGQVIDFRALVEHCRALPSPCLIEGIGGVLVPLDQSHTVADWIQATAMPALLVGGSYLGTLNHILCAAAVLRQRSIPLAGVVVSESREQPVPLEETVTTLKRFLPEQRVQALPRLSSSRAWHEAPDLLADLEL